VIKDGKESAGQRKRIAANSKPKVRRLVYRMGPCLNRATVKTVGQVVDGISSVTM
jgi:hypothetical protein